MKGRDTSAEARIEFVNAHQNRLGWLAVTLIAVAVTASWAPALALPLGDSHEGRILGRQGLQVDNFWELGPLGSGLASDWSPYATSPYAHHPPLTNAFQVGTSAVIGQGEPQLRLFGYLAGIATIFGVAAVLRAARIRWLPSLLAIGLMVATPFFWIFGRLGVGIALILFLAAAVMRLREASRPSGWLVWSAAALGLLTALSAWEGMFAAALLGIWLATGRGLDRPTLLVGVAMVFGAALALAWIGYASGFDSVITHADDRTDITFTVRQFVVRQAGYAARLFPVWYLALGVPALVAGIWDIRTRVVVSITLLGAAAFAIGLPQNAWIHEYWNYPVMAPIAIGTAALLEWAADRLSGRWVRVGGAMIALVAVVWFAALALGPTHDDRFARSAEVGRLLRENPPSADQATAWVAAGVVAPRWLSYYWDLSFTWVTPEMVAEIPPGDLVLMRLDEKAPEWAPDKIGAAIVATRGSYVLVQAADLQAASP